MPIQELAVSELALAVPEGLIQKQDPKDALLCRAW